MRILPLSIKLETYAKTYALANDIEPRSGVSLIIGGCCVVFGPYAGGVYSAGDPTGVIRNEALFESHQVAGVQ